MSPKADKPHQKSKGNHLTKREFTPREWEEIFNAITEMIVVIDKNQHILRANKAVLEKFNLRKEQIIGQKCYKFFHEGVDPTICPCAQYKFTKSRKSISQEVYDKKLGRTYLVSIYPRYKENSAIKDFVHIIKDITEIKEAEKNMRMMAITDFLTGVYNQRHFYHQLEEEIERVMRYKGTFSLILFDIDEFKSLNDKHGHLEGDNALARVGQIVNQRIRKTDSAYRYGGDEFVILMPQTNKNKAVKMAERLLQSFRNSVLITEEQKPVYKTLSIGVTEYKKDDDLKVIIERVDKAMYAAKRTGGNKVYVF